MSIYLHRDPKELGWPLMDWKRSDHFRDQGSLEAVEACPDQRPRRNCSTWFPGKTEFFFCFSDCHNYAIKLTDSGKVFKPKMVRRFLIFYSWAFFTRTSAAIPVSLGLANLENIPCKPYPFWYPYRCNQFTIPFASHLHTKLYPPQKKTVPKWSPFHWYSWSHLQTLSQNPLNKQVPPFRRPTLLAARMTRPAVVPQSIAMKKVMRITMQNPWLWSLHLMLKYLKYS